MSSIRLLTAVLGLALIGLPGCAHRERKSAHSPGGTLLHADARGIEARFEHIESQLARIERLRHARSAHRKGVPPPPDLRPLFASYRKAEKRQRAFFARHGFLRAEYFRQQMALLELFSIQLRGIEASLVALQH